MNTFYEVVVTFFDGSSYKAWMRADEIKEAQNTNRQGDGPEISLTGAVRFDIVEPEPELS